VLNCLANGRSNKEIGQILYISEHTAKAHVRSIMTKLSADSRTEDDACILEFVGKQSKQAITRVVVQRVEGFINHYQTRLVQQYACEGQKLLFLIGQFLRIGRAVG
jgi:Bacterial regulatory proteins, luxR family